MNAKLSRRRVLVAMFCSAPLAGCSVLPDPPAPQIYRLRPLADDAPSKRRIRKRLVVDIPTASESLDTDRIALIRARTRFDYYANSLWTDRVPLLLQGLLVEAFENDGSIAEVGRDAQTLTPDYLLVTEIRDFEARYTGSGQQTPSVVVTLDFSLVKMPDHQMIGRTLITESSSAARDNVDSVVEAFDVAVGKALVRSIAWTTGIMTHAAGRNTPYAAITADPWAVKLLNPTVPPLSGNVT
jgi:cholesterol transport system auxiliary component